MGILVGNNSVKPRNQSLCFGLIFQVGFAEMGKQHVFFHNNSSMESEQNGKHYGQGR
jgi:hypothetical protein